MKDGETRNSDLCQGKADKTKSRGKVAWRRQNIIDFVNELRYFVASLFKELLFFNHCTSCW